MIEDWIILYEPLIHFGLFVIGLILFWALERLYPMLTGLESPIERWLKSVFLVAIGIGFARVILQAIPVAFAIQVYDQKIGLFSKEQGYSPVVIIITILALDFFMFLGHRLFHRVSFLWQIHKVHHLDKEVDVTTGMRFHPIEIIILLGIKMVAILFLGAPVLAVLIYELLFCFFLQFTHANIRLPKKLDYLLKYIIVTPSMHRIHHSDIIFEHNSNYGFCFSIWDRILNSYRAMSHVRVHKMIFGLEQYRLPIFHSLGALMVLPFNFRRFKPKKSISTLTIRE